MKNVRTPSQGTSPSAPAQKRRGIRLALVLILHLGMCLAAIWSLSSAFYLSRRVVLLHMLIVLGLSGLVISFAGYALRRHWISNSPRTRLAFSVGMTAAATTFAVIYAGDAVSNFFWGSNLNYRLAMQYVSILMPSRPPLFISGWIHIALLAGVAAIFAVYWRSANFMVSALEQSVVTPSEHATDTRARARVALAFGVV